MFSFDLIFAWKLPLINYFFKIFCLNIQRLCVIDTNVFYAIKISKLSIVTFFIDVILDRQVLCLKILSFVSNSCRIKMPLLSTLQLILDLIVNHFTHV